MGKRLSPVLGRPVDFNVTEYKFIDMFQNTFCNLTFQRLPLVKFCIGSNIHNYLQRLLKYSFFYNYISTRSRIFFIYFNQNNILQQTECKQCMRTSLSSCQPNMEEICKHKTVLSGCLRGSIG